MQLHGAQEGRYRAMKHTLLILALLAGLALWASHDEDLRRASRTVRILMAPQLPL